MNWLRKLISPLGGALGAAHRVLEQGERLRSSFREFQALNPDLAVVKEWKEMEARLVELSKALKWR